MLLNRAGASMEAVIAQLKSRRLDIKVLGFNPWEPSITKESSKSYGYSKRLFEVIRARFPDEFGKGLKLP